MKGTKTTTPQTKFFLSLTKEDFKIIYTGLGHLQLNYINLLEDTKDPIEYNVISKELKKVNINLNILKELKHES